MNVLSGGLFTRQDADKAPEVREGTPGHEQDRAPGDLPAQAAYL
jgi:hypothetical protein